MQGSELRVNTRYLVTYILTIPGGGVKIEDRPKHRFSGQYEGCVSDGQLIFRIHGGAIWLRPENVLSAIPTDLPFGTY